LLFTVISGLLRRLAESMSKASLIWLNYNSRHFIDVALRSIDSVLNLDFDDYEVIIVDNASTDGSFETIRRFVERHKPSHVGVRFVRSDANRGYAGGMNMGWEARDPDAEYVAFLNNDLIVEPESLRKIIEHMNGDEEIAAANGLIYFGDGKTIFSAGGFVTENLVRGNICYKVFEDDCPGVGKPHYVTYASGAYMVVKVDAVRRACPDGKPFMGETFLYLDDDLLGLILWNKGYKVMYVPVKSGAHYEGLTAGIKRGKVSFSKFYWYRNSTVLYYLVHSRYYRIMWLYSLRRLIGYKVLAPIRQDCGEIYEAVRDGLRIRHFFIKKVGVLSLYKAPYVPVSTIDVLLHLLLLRRPPRAVTHEMLRVSDVVPAR
jgi:GT2 family glycosyltransferase